MFHSRKKGSIRNNYRQERGLRNHTIVANGNDFDNNSGNDSGNQHWGDNEDCFLNITKNAHIIILDHTVSDAGFSKRVVSGIIKDLKETDRISRKRTKKECGSYLNKIVNNILCGGLTGI